MEHLTNQSLGDNNLSSLINGSEESTKFQANQTLNGGQSTLSIIRKFQLFALLVISPVGIILNVFCTRIFYKLKMYKAATGLHMTCISVTDNLAILGIFIFAVNIQNNHSLPIPNIMTQNKHFCKFFFALGAFAMNASSLLLTSCAVQRCISIYFPLKTKQWNMFVVSKYLIATYMFVSLAVGALRFYAARFDEMPNRTMCTVDFLTFNHSWVAATQRVLYFVISNGVTSALTLICTVMIAINLFKSKRQRDSMTSTTSNSVKKEFFITLMLFTVCVVYVSAKMFELTMQSLLVFHRNRNVAPNTLRNMLAFISVAQLLLAVNHSINFFVYFIFLKDFKAYVVSTFQSRQRQPTHGETSVSTTSFSTSLSSALERSRC